MNQEDIKQFSTDELREKIQDEKTTLNKLKLNHSVSPIENPSNITYTRKTIARLSTELRSRELAELTK
jgi:large subunit ribosomal protein L29